MTVLDWNVDADRNNIRPGSIELQRAVHREWHEKIKSRPPEGWLKAKPLWRVRTIEKLELTLGRPIFGEVLEIGAGSALCSAFAAKRDTVSRVTAMDYDQFCVDEMMPTVFEKFEAPPHKIRRALGSYNRIPDVDFYDFILSAGALHHAESLPVAFAALYSALKPGGVLLISDVCEFDHVTNLALLQRYETADPDGPRRYGRAVKLKDNGDHWYRFSEWLGAARGAGFEALPYLFDEKAGEPAGDEIFVGPKLWRGFAVRSFQPYFADRGHFDPLVMILQKPAADGTSDLVSDSLTESGEMIVRPNQSVIEDRLTVAIEEAERQRARAAKLKTLLRTAEEKAKGAGRGRLGWLRRFVGR
jgi:SAM-dependent methyltransferase